MHTPWLNRDLYPFADHFLDLDGARVHYVDHGHGPLLLMLHGNPTWSFLYREIIAGLADRYRCIAPDYPGFGLSTAPPGYNFTPAEHAAVVEKLIVALDVTDVTLMVQDWGGPIGFSVATRHPHRFAAFVVGNTFAWPRRDPMTQVFSRLVGGPVGRRLVERRNLFVERILPGGVALTTLTDDVMAAYRGPFPTRESRRPMHRFAREILASRPFLAEVERGLPALRRRPALFVWPTRDPAFGERERRRWRQVLPHHETVTLDGAGHFIQEDAPAEIVAAVARWQSARAGSASGSTSTMG